MRGRGCRAAISGGLDGAGWRENVGASLKPNLKSAAAERHLIAARKPSIAIEAFECRTAHCAGKAGNRSLGTERAASRRGAHTGIVVATNRLLGADSAASGRVVRAEDSAGKASNHTLGTERAAWRRGAHPGLAAATNRLLGADPAASDPVVRAGRPAGKASRCA